MKSTDPPDETPSPLSAVVPVLGMRHGVLLSLAILSAASLAAIAYSANAPLIRATFNLTEVEVGAIASCIYIGAAASSIASGRLTDSLGSGAVLAMSMLALALGVAISATAPLAVIFFLGLAVAGLGYGAVNPPTNVLANPDSPRHRGLSMSIKQSGIPLGGILAGILVPTVAATTGWRWSMVIPIVACIALAIISSRLQRADPPDGEEVGGSARVRVRLPHAYVFGFLMAGIQVAIFIFLALYLVDARGFDASRAGSALALLLVGGLVGRPTWGWVSDRLHSDRVRVLQMAALLSATFLVMFPLVGESVLILVLVGMGLCSVGWNGVYLAMLAEAVPPRLIGSTTGMALLLVHLGAVALPPVVGLIVASAGNWSISWSLCAGMSLLSAGVLQMARIRDASRPLEGELSNAL